MTDKQPSAPPPVPAAPAADPAAIRLANKRRIALSPDSAAERKLIAKETAARLAGKPLYGGDQ